MSITKVKTQTKFMVLFTSGSSLTWGNLQAPSMASPPGICLHFFDGKEERWGEKMRGCWGDLSICPCLDSLELPCYTLGELLSISHLKIWGDTQEPHNDMAYLLVHTEGDSEAESYGMALVWISPHQARVSTMEEVLGTLYTCISSGPKWPYCFCTVI